MQLLNLGKQPNQEFPEKTDFRVLAGLGVALLTVFLSVGLWLILFWSIVFGASGYGFEIEPEGYVWLVAVLAVPIAGAWLTRRLLGISGDNDEGAELATASGSGRELEARKILVHRIWLRSAILIAILANGITLLFNIHSRISGRIATGVFFMYLFYLVPCLVTWFLIRRWTGRWPLSLALTFSVLFSCAIILGLSVRVWHDHTSSAWFSAAALCSLALLCNIMAAVMAWRRLLVYGWNINGAVRLSVCGIGSFIYILMLSWLSL